MKDVLRESEAQKYEECWADASYRERCHGLDLWRDHNYLFPQKIVSAIDFGCGTGRLVKEWARSGIEALGIDIAPNAADPEVSGHVKIACLWDFKVAHRYQVGVCADVMEHIPPAKVEDVLSCISKACRMCVFKIANYPSIYKDRMLHLSLHPEEWWLAMLQRFGEVKVIAGRHGIDEYIFQVKFH